MLCRTLLRGVGNQGQRTLRVAQGLGGLRHWGAQSSSLGQGQPLPGLDFLQVDAFTPVALAGNPAGVLFTQRGGDEEWMQAVAEENNLSETAYLEERSDSSPGRGTFDIRWFTPGGEVDLCGHATLASAHALWDTGRVPSETPITFQTRNCGALHCSKSGSWIKMDFPAQLPEKLEDGELAARRPEIAAALRVEVEQVLYVGRGPPTTPDWLVEISAEAFAQLAPDIKALGKVEPSPRGLIVTCGGAGRIPGPPAGKRPRILPANSDGPFDFLSRFFAPLLGLDEDPVTGSAHCVLAPYWAEKLGMPAGSPMQALQASPRGGLLRVRYLKDTARVELEGEAVTVIRGRFAA